MPAKFRRITEPLTPLQWDAVLEFLYEAGAEGVPLAVSMERMRTDWGVLPCDLEQVPALFKEYQRDKWRDRVESPGALEDALHVPAASTRRLPQGVMGMLCEAVESMFGQHLLKAKVGWRRGPEVLLREGDTYEEKTGEGPGWIVSAVIVRRADGTEETFAECRVRGVRRTTRAGCKHPHLILWQLQFCDDRVNDRNLLRRLAAWKVFYFGEESGVESAAAFARAAGVKKQTFHKQLKGVERTAAQRRKPDGQKPQTAAVAGDNPFPPVAISCPAPSSTPL